MLQLDEPGNLLNVTSSSKRPRRGWLSRSIPEESMARVCSLLKPGMNSTSGSKSADDGG